MYVYVCHAYRRRLWLHITVLIKGHCNSTNCCQGSLTSHINVKYMCFFLEPHLKLLLFIYLFSFCLSSSSVWSFDNVCSEGGGQHADHHDRLSCRWSHCIDNGLHAAQELHSLCSFQAWGEKVSVHDQMDIYQQCNHVILFQQYTLLVLGCMFQKGQMLCSLKILSEACFKYICELLPSYSASFFSSNPTAVRSAL